MKSVKTKYSTRTLGVDQGFLPLYVEDICDGPYIKSRWAPTLRERLRILFGGHVTLTLMARGHPPVRIDAFARNQ